MRRASSWIVLSLAWVVLLCAAWLRPVSRAAVEPAPVGYQLRINHEPAHRFQALHGIGPALADAIVEHREQHGPLRDADDLEAIPGIGPRKRARVAPWVRFE